MVMGVQPKPCLRVAYEHMLKYLLTDCLGLSWKRAWTARITMIRALQAYMTKAPCCDANPQQ